MKKNAVNTAQTSQNKLVRRASGLMALEQRFMFDGAAVGDALDKAIDLNVLAPVALVSRDTLAQAEARAEQLVTQFLAQPNVRDQLLNLFKGGQTGSAPSAEWQAAVDQLLARAEQGDLTLRVELRSNTELQGAKGAFSSTGTTGEATVYINADWLATADSESVTLVLTEELGHYLDNAINGNADTHGDEGEVFAQFVVNGTQPLPLSFDLTGDDHTTLSLDGQQVLAELASFNFVNAYEMVYDRDNSTAGKTTAQITSGDIATTERWADKEQNSHYFNASVSLGVVSISDGTNGQNFSGNDVSASTVIVGGTTYHGWISRPIKAGGVVRGFYFWTDTRFTTLALAQADGNQDGDSSVLNNRGFLFVVDQAWFNTQIAAGTTNITINNTKDGNDGVITVANVGSSSDRVDSALNSLLVPNTAPTAANDALTVSEDSTITTVSAVNGLLSNDSDANNDALTITGFSVGGVSTTLTSGTATYLISGSGTVTIRADGGYDFTPVAGFNGYVAPITYTVSDGNGGTKTAVLSITVTPVNDPPVAVADTGTVTEDTPSSGLLMSNDSDPDGNPITVQSFSVTGLSGPFTLGTAYSIPSKGTITVNANGSYTFVPAANFTGTVPVINYTISDGKGGTASSTLTLTMSAANDAPVANPDNANGALYATAAACSSNTAVAATTQQGNVLSNDTDSDVTLVAGTTHQVTAVTSEIGNTWSGTTVVGRYGTLTIGADGQYTYVINGDLAAVKALTASEELSEIFTYTVTENTAAALTASSTLRAVIRGSNNGPDAIDDFGYIQIIASDSTTGNLLRNDLDIDGTAPTVSNIGSRSTTYSVGAYDNNLSAASGDTASTVKIGKGISGNVNNAPISSAMTTLVSTTVSISDTGAAMKFNFNTLEALNSFKAANPLGAGESYYLYVATANKNGVIELGSLQASTNSQSVTSAASTTITGTYGSITIASDGAYTYTRGANTITGTQHDYFTYTLTDGSCSDTAVLDITIVGATNLSDRTLAVNEDATSSGSPSTGVLLAADNSTAITVASYKAMNPDGTTTAGTLATFLSVTGGSIKISSDGSYAFYADANYNGPIPTIEYTTSDGSKANLNITVAPVNDAPSGTDKSVSLTDKQTYVFSSADFGFYETIDSPPHAFQSVTITTLPLSGQLTLDGVAISLGASISLADLNAGKLVFTPAANAASAPNTDFTFQVRDDGGTAAGGVNLDASPNTFSFNVSLVNDPPVNTLPTGLQTNSYSPIDFALLSTLISSADPDHLDSARQIDTVVLSVLKGTLSVTAGTGVSLSGNGTGTLTLTSTGTQAALQAVLATLVYSPTSSFSGSDALTMTTTDKGGLKDIDATPITVTADNRTLSVTGTTVNEASPYVYFRVGGAASQWITLALQETTNANSNATMGTDFLPNLQYFDGTDWQNYVGSAVQIPSTGTTLLVRTGVLQDAPYEGGETLRLVATNQANTAVSGNSTIIDDGTGSIYLGSNNTFTADTSGTGYPAYLDDDRPVTVDNIAVNEASPWAMFTVTGYANQVLSLALLDGTAKVGDGSPSDGSEDYSPNLEYWSGTAWTTYDGTSVTMAGSTLLVRTAVHQDTLFEGQHTFGLGVTKLSANATVYGAASIYDDGTGNIYAFDDVNDGSATVTAGPGAGFDDDRTLTINSPLVNEASDYVVFTITGNSGQTVTLQLEDDSSNGTVTGKANILESQTLKIWDGLAWVNYDATNLPTFSSSGKIFVRVDIVAEQDTPYEGGETFKLNATLVGQSAVVTGTATIIDDGTGVKFPGTFTNGSPTTETTALDDDRVTLSTITVTGGNYNENSPRAVFTVTANAGQVLTLDVQNAAESGKAPTGDNEGKPNDSLDTADIYYSLDGGTTWQIYTGPVTAGSVPVLVAIDITNERDDVYEGEEQLKLVVTSGGQAASAFSSIFDDGTGTVTKPITELTTNDTGANDPTVVKDDDRPITVTGGNYNENSPRAVFTVTANAGQVLTLDVQNAAESGKAPTGDNEGKPNDSLDTADIYYSLDGGTTWQLYTGPVTAGSVPVLVAIDITNERDDVYEGEEQLKLVVTSGGQSASGYSSIFDDGTGLIKQPDGTTDNTTPKDDDRPLTVNNIRVNEGSPYAVFTVTGKEGQQVKLNLSNGTATIENGNGTVLTDGSEDFGPALQYWNGLAWTNYTANSFITIPSDGDGTAGETAKLLVRTAVNPDALDEGDHTFTLTATNTGLSSGTGTATIDDHGGGLKFPDVAPTGPLTTDPSPVTDGTNLDDDRAFTVTGGTYNENSPRAVFTVNANPGQLLTLDVQNAAEPGKAPTGDNEGKPNDSLDTADIYYSLDGGTTWQLYTGPVTAGSVPVLVAIDITNERDDVYEGEEQLKLVVTSGGQSASGYSSIFDDGTGLIKQPDGTTDNTTPKDDDRPKPAPLPLPPEAPLPAAPAPEAPQPDPVKPPTQAFSSEVQPLAPRLVPVEAPVPLGDVLTSSSGFRVAVNETASPGLALNRGITDQFVEGNGSSAKISMPFDAFIHSNKDAVIKLDAKQADNSPLPNWVRFDPATGSFEVNPPKDFKGKLDLKVVALDDDGREAVAIFQLFVGDKPAEQKPQSRNSLTEKLRLAGQRPITLIKVGGEATRTSPSPEVALRAAAVQRATAG